MFHRSGNFLCLQRGRSRGRFFVAFGPLGRDVTQWHRNNRPQVCSPQKEQKETTGTKCRLQPASTSSETLIWAADPISILRNSYLTCRSHQHPQEPSSELQIPSTSSGTCFWPVYSHAITLRLRKLKGKVMGLGTCFLKIIQGKLYVPLHFATLGNENRVSRLLLFWKLLEAGNRPQKKGRKTDRQK